jgi:uncharacterized protein YjbI with pentapeptide repeats
MVDSSNDFSHKNLSGQNFHKAQLAGSDFTEVNLANRRESRALPER